MLINKILQDKVEDNSLELEDIVNSIVSKYTDKLDEYMSKIHSVLTDDGDELTEADMAKILITLNSYAYFIGAKAEISALRADVSEMVYSERYNLELLASSGTVAARSSIAASKSQEEEVIKIIYGRVYKILKNKLDATIRMSDGVKKIISLRVKAMELAGRSNA